MNSSPRAAACSHRGVVIEFEMSIPSASAQNA